MMKQTREFEIAWQGLKLGAHTFRYDLDNRFFQDMETDPDLRDMEAGVVVRFEKHTGFFLLHFDVDGEVTVSCDRCGDDYRLRLWDEFDLLIKLTGEDAPVVEEDADAVFIPRSETVLDIRGWLYEYVMLSVPIQRIHPDGADGQPGCNPAALNLLQQLSENREIKGTLWKGLESLKGKQEQEKEE